MKISYQWLKEFVDVPVDAGSLGGNLTQVGLALESSEEVGNDVVLDLDVTTNRPDCLSHLGVAREAGTIYDKPVMGPNLRALPESPGHATTDIFSVSIDDAELCGRYCGRYIAGVRIGPSPEWLKTRLERLGVRSINNVADVTNYVMLELGQPLHAFDADRLAGRAVIVRRAGIDETLTTLDGTSRKLNSSILVIADQDKPVALAGIMGGGETEITQSTVNVFLESAYFNPLAIRQTARALAMTTEASYRFERGADIEMSAIACDRAASMIQELAGGELFHGIIDVYPGKPNPRRIALRRERIRTVLGAPVEDGIIDNIFERLGLRPSRTDMGWSVEAPTFRVDLNTEEDLLEEIARHYGFDKFPSTYPPSLSFGALLPDERRIRQLRNTLAGTGYTEICTYSFSNEELERRFYPDIAPVRLQNPMSEEATILRTSLIPGMLLTLQWNLNRGMRDLQLYELNKVYWNGGERRTLLMAGCGNVRIVNPHDQVKDFDFFSLKGDIEEILSEFNIPARITRDNIPGYYHPGRFARIGHIAIFGELHPKYAEPFKFRQRIYLAEVDMELLLAAPMEREITQIPRYPAVKRDFSILLDKGTQYASVQKTISGTGIPELTRVEPFDRMESGPFPESKYSLSISVTYQSSERTLTDSDVESFDQAILKSLEERLGAQLRK